MKCPSQRWQSAVARESRNPTSDHRQPPRPRTTILRGTVPAAGGLLAALALMTVTTRGLHAAEQAGEIVLASDDVRLVVAANGHIIGFREKATGKERAAAGHPGALVSILHNGRWLPPKSCGRDRQRLKFEFADGDATVTVQVHEKPRWLSFEVVEVSDAAVEQVQLVNLPLASAKQHSSMSGVAADDQFAACLRSLNLETAVVVGGSPVTLSARSELGRSPVGVKAALVGCRRAELREVLKDLLKAEGVPTSPLGGPWALDAPQNRTRTFTGPVVGFPGPVPGTSLNRTYRTGS